MKVKRLIMRSHWVRRIGDELRQPEEIPRVLGLGLVGVYVAGMVVIGGIVWRFHHQTVEDLAAAYAQQTADLVASSIATPVEDNLADVRMQIFELAARPTIDGVLLVNKDGDILAAHDASLIGMHVDRARPPEEWSPLTFDASGHAVRHFARSKLGGDDSDDELVIASQAVPVAGGFSQLWLAGALSLLAVLLSLLLVYRAIRHALTPAAAIRRKLMALGGELQTELDMFRISSEHGELASAWNKLLDLVGELQTELAGLRSNRELVRALEHLENQQEAALIELLPDGVLLVDEDGTLACLNQAARRLLGVGADDTPGHVQDLTPHEDLNALLVRLSRANRRRSQANVHHTIGSHDTETTLLISTRVVELDGGFRGTLILIRDVSQQKHAERARDDFLHQVTHELRTPLSNIRAYTETLMEGILDDKEAYKECLNVINTEARRLGRLVEDVLQASQIEVGAVRLNVGRVEFRRLLEQCVQDLQATANEKDIELHLQLPSKVPTVRCDKERLAVVFMNLIGNALKYTNAGGHTNVECRVHSNLIEVAVRDDGIGIAADEIDNVFDKFFRSKSADVQSRPGTGLGLATARQIVRLHGGELSVASDPGAGSCFTVTLPVGDHEETTTVAAPSEPAATPVETMKGEGHGADHSGR